MHEFGSIPSATIPANERVDYWHWRDEILQVMYWLIAEGFRKEVALGDLLRFLQVEQSTIVRHLDTLIDEGYLERSAEPDQPFPLERCQYHFTPSGRLEARKRFLDEFQPLSRSHDHSQCPPESPCHEEGADHG